MNDSSRGGRPATRLRKQTRGPLTKRRARSAPHWIIAQVREIFQSRRILIEQIIGAFLDDTLLHQLVDVLAHDAKMQGQLRARYQRGAVMILSCLYHRQASSMPSLARLGECWIRLRIAVPRTRRA
jgi:hypothetical protein